MDVMYYSPHRNEQWEKRGVQYLPMSKLITSSEIIVVCSPTNVRVLSEADFKATREGTVLVQASAGSPFDRLAFLGWIAQEGNYALFDMSAGEDNYRAYKDLPR